MREALPSDLITTSEARALLGVSWNKMAKLLKIGTVRYFQNPLDHRVKLVSRGEVLSLLPKPPEAK